MLKSALIWDLDGTLIDSYACIVPALRRFYAEKGLQLEEAELLRGVLSSTVRDYAREVEARTGVSLTADMGRYQELRAVLEREIRPIPHAREALQALAAAGVRSYLYTHRGASTAEMLRRTGLADLLEDTVTAEAGFPRKPDPGALLWLLDRYDLDPARTFYVGDRQLDVACAANAGLRAILYRPPGSPVPLTAREAAVIGDLAELPALLPSLFPPLLQR